MHKSEKREISARIAKLRVKVAGPRGKASFAKLLGISPSTYDYYEASRVPPADILVAIADLAEVDLRWLITGQEPLGPTLTGQHALIKRAADLLANKPNAAKALGAFLDILAESLEFPDATAAQQAPGPVLARSQDASQTPPEWIPILGRSAAGIPQFWSNPDAAKYLTSLADLVGRQSSPAKWSTRPARTGATETIPPTTVQMITLDQPAGNDTTEFVSAKPIKSKWPDAFALRIDGASMAPDIAHGDVVVISPSAPAVNGKAAVIQLVGQIGVTCKIYRRQESSVHLIPINDRFEPKAFPSQDISWALQVLARIRPA